MSKEELKILSNRIPKRLYERCRELAKEQKISFNEFLVRTLEAVGGELPNAAEQRLTARIEKLEEAVFGKKND